MEYVLSEIKKLQKELERYKSSEFSKIVPLATHVRILNDNVARAAVYGPNNLTVISVGTLPAYITGIWYSVALVGNSAANAVQLNIFDPDSGSSVISIGGKLVAAGDVLTGSGFVKLGAASGANPGQLTYTLASGTYSLLIIDVLAYLL